MTTNKNGKQLKMHRIPPQPRRKSLLETAGEVSKPFIITIITFVAILALLLLLLFSKQFVGKALYMGAENSAGLVVGKVMEDEAFKAIVKANIGASQTSTLSFTLDLPEGVSCNYTSETKELLPDSLLKKKPECKSAPGLGGQIVYTYTTLGNPSTGELQVAEISFTPLAAGSYDLKFSQFEVLDEKNNKIILSVLNPTIEVQKKLAPQPPGIPCVSDNDCSEGNECKNSMCAAKQVEVQKKLAPKLPPGSPCVSDDDCSEGNECKSSVCVAKLIAPLPGVSCKLDADCISGYECKNSMCAAKQAAVQQLIPGEQPSLSLKPDVTGKKVTLTDIAPANNLFSTQIAATEDFGQEVMVYTVLYGMDNKVLSLQQEKIVAGLKKGTTYTATVNYPQSNVKKKTVLLYDVEANPQVHALLEKTFAVS